MIDDARARLAEAQTQSAQALEGLLAELDAATQRLDTGPRRMIRRARRAGGRNALGVVLIVLAMLALGGLGARRAGCCARRRPTPKRSAAPTRRSPRTPSSWSTPPIASKARHRRKLRAVLAQERARLAQYDRLTIMRLNVRRPQEPSILFSKCLPRPPEQTNPLFENARMVQARWDEDFAAALDRALRGAAAGGTARASPIVAGLRAVAADPDFDAAIPRRRLVLVSDLLEHDPDGFSLYVTDANYSSWRAQTAERGAGFFPRRLCASCRSTVPNTRRGKPPRWKRSGPRSSTPPMCRA